MFKENEMKIIRKYILKKFSNQFSFRIKKKVFLTKNIFTFLFLILTFNIIFFYFYILLFLKLNLEVGIIGVIGGCMGLYSLMNSDRLANSLSYGTCFTLSSPSSSVYSES